MATASRLPRCHVAMNGHSIGFRLATAPGIALHEFAHWLACRLLGVVVLDVSFFRLTGRPGYVEHETPPTWGRTVVVALAPLFVNVLVAALSLQYAVSIHGGVGPGAVAVGAGLLWVSLAALVHAIPSLQDVRQVWAATLAHWTRYPLVPVAAPVYAVRALGRHVGIYRVTTPVSIAVLVGFVALHGLSAAAVVACLRSGAWGCWTAPVLLVEWISSLLA